MRRLCVFGVVIVAAVTGPAAPRAQTPAAAPGTAPTQRVWTGTWEEHDAWEGSNVVGRSQAQITLTYVQGRDEFGGLRWESRRLKWSARWEETRFDQLILGIVGAPDERGLYKNRYPADIVTSCAGGGTLELGPAVAGFGDDLTPEQKAQLLAPCVTTYQPRESGVPTPPPAPTDPRALLQVLGMPNEDELTGCAYEKSWPKGGRPAGSFSVSVSGPVSAKVFPTASGEPTPGAAFLHVEGRSPVPVRWKFVLVEASRLRGYATNADITPAFFEIYNLPSLRGRYGTMDPDLIFDPSKFEPPWDQSRQWKRPYPDSGPHKWSVLESNDEWTSVSVDVTAMDLGAHGELQVYVSSTCGDGWVQVEVDETPGAAGIAIPNDDADGNFIPDSLKAYAGLAALADTDATPAGDGTAGDGFTAFEEYRGFVKPVGGACNSLLSVRHERTNPAVKDLFVHSSDLMLRNAVAGTPFTDASGLALHLICPAQYVDNETRIVNFTMQVNPGTSIRGARLSQDFPQHGLHLVNEPLVGFQGRSIGRPGASHFGPPRNIDRVAVDVEQIIAAHRGTYPMRDIRRTTIHELGHAIGVRHHADKNLTGPVVLLNMPACAAGMSEGTVAGDRACVATYIALRGGQNSGDATCPMKYTRWKWYVPPGATLVPAGPVDFRPAGSYSWLRRRELPGYVLRVDQVRRYRDDLDEASIAQSLWKFCVTRTGTGINALPGAENHAGDSPRECAPQIRVNDKEW